MDSLIVVYLLFASLLVIFGGLLGHTLTQQLMARELRQRAKLGREIGKQWRELQGELERLDELCCANCGRSVRQEPTVSERVPT